MSDKEETVTLTIQRTSDAKSTKIEISMSQSLNDLKDAIAESGAYGSLSRPDQRLFHLGRELKNCGRSLSNLGIGRFNNLHLLLLTKSTEAANNNHKTTAVAAHKARRARPAPCNGTASSNNVDVVDMLEDSDDDSDDEDDIVYVGPKGNRDPPGSRKRQRTS